MTSTTGPFVECGQRDKRPVWTWAPDWWDLLANFKARRFGIFEEPYEEFEPNWHGLPDHYRYPLSKLTRTQRDELSGLAVSLHHIELPNDGFVYLTGTTNLLGHNTQAFVAALGETLRQQHGQRAAVFIPLVRSGGSNGVLEFHADLWYQRILMSIFEQPSPREGLSYAISLDDFASVAAAHIPKTQLEEILSILRRDWWAPTNLVLIFELLWAPDWADALREDVRSAATATHFAPGEGYILDDGNWLHARDYLSLDEARTTRLHRLTFDTLSTEKLRVEPSPVTPRGDQFSSEFEHDVPPRWTWGNGRSFRLVK